ncbi:hypothetical protein L1047_00385 [Synechococcus sp. Nb3U1]|uniref:hypothetical protein n=1 Tax=Synechococcus sp. Nb3U1 TaxID=1914529 RepID=UPI001F33DF7B|nr:hypothetical protein [Synechococcus sp. Nb3U1]MCF2969655.1 hypothetical protein [Synechococcus sp. Nb3U1]
MNRRWNDQTNDNDWQTPAFDPELYIDDDVLGFMRAEGAKMDASEEKPAKKNGEKTPKGTKRNDHSAKGSFGSNPCGFNSALQWGYHFQC